MHNPNESGRLNEAHVLLTVKCTERSCGQRVRHGELTDDANTHWHVKPGVALVPVADLVREHTDRALAEAWDEGYSCGLGDYGKDPARETCAANPYRAARQERGR